mgnify:CR=1 FL=1
MLTEDALNHLNIPLDLKIISNNFKMIITKENNLFVVKIKFPKELVLRVSKSEFLRVFEKLFITL